jgi:hypothetical protein
MNLTWQSKSRIAGLVAALVISPGLSLAASDFEGVWKVKDTAGTPFEITLSENGTAKANRGEGMSGTWKEEGKTAVISWSTGWVTKISKEGGHYKKTAYRKGQPLDATPANSSDAVKTR